MSVSIEFLFKVGVFLEVNSVVELIFIVLLELTNRVNILCISFSSLLKLLEFIGAGVICENFMCGSGVGNL